jgi:hypothetical protein
LDIHRRLAILGIVAIGGSIALKLEVVTHTTFFELPPSAPALPVSSLHQFLQIQGSLDYIADIDSDA